MAGLVALLVAAVPVHAIEVAPVSEHEARQLADALPHTQAMAPAASQPVALKSKPPAATGPEGRSGGIDGHPGALALAALALLLWGMHRTRRH